MTREECKELLMTFEVKYNTFKINPEYRAFTINAWYEDLKTYDYADVKRACAAYRDTANSAYAPSTSQIIGMLKESKQKYLSPIDAWNLVRKAISNGYYAAEEGFAKLPPVVQRAVGSPRNIREYSFMESVDIQNNIQPRFYKAYEIECRREEMKPFMTSEKRQMLEEKIYKLAPMLEEKRQEQNETSGISEGTKKAIEALLESLVPVMPQKNL